MASTYASVRRKTRRTRRPIPPSESRLVVVGNGMVGSKFCEALVEKGLNLRFRITVLAAEPLPAYDRIKLSSYVEHRRPEKLLLKTAEWYDENRIDLRIGTAAETLDREGGTLNLSDGSDLAYDLLVLATGSRPFIPPIPGAELSGVLPYRTIADLEAIIAAAEGKGSATIIGGGLLGLEAAQAIQGLGLKTAVVERANFLMPQQLNEAASGLLRDTVESQDIRLFLGKNSTTIERKNEQLTLDFGDESTTTDLVIVSAGISPNDQLARDTELPVGARGGVVVNRHLETSDPRIFAIGECALLEGRIYGLAAPGFAMARHLAARLAGEKLLPLPDPDLSTRLKMLGANVVIIGNPLEEGTRHEYRAEGIYRLILTGPEGLLRGALGIGSWEESGRVLSLFQEEALLRPNEIERFVDEGSLLAKGSIDSVVHWPDHRVVCNCMNVSKGQLAACMAKGCNTAKQLAAETDASTVCGSCQPLLEELCGVPPTTTKPVAARSMMAVSIIALLAVLVTIFAPPPAMAESVESARYKLDQLWRDNLIKQITGYTLAGLFLIGLLLSLRKRIRWFRIGHFARWRVFHALFGLVSLFALFAHTGFRFGHNLNFWLMLTFVGINLVGAAAGIVAAIESRGTSGAALVARRFRPALVWAHIILFWPLPVLLTFHILSVYFY